MIVSDELTDLYTRATELAMKRGDTVGENNEYYITLEELQRLMEKYAHETITV